MQVIGLHHELVGQAAMARTAGRAVHVFTAHTEAMMTAALDAPGVDFIITDYPHRLRRVRSLHNATQLHATRPSPESAA